MPADAETIHRVSVASCRAAYEDVLDDEAFLDMVDDPSRADALRAYLSDTEADEPVVYLVAETEGVVVGFAQCLSGDERPPNVDGDEAYLKSLYVHPDNWRDGIGSELLREAISRLQRTVTRVRVSVLAANTIGTRFYEIHDFEQIDNGTFDVGAVEYETTIYVREL